VAEVREATYWWILGYNKQQPHDPLDDMTPVDGEAYACGPANIN